MPNNDSSEILCAMADALSPGERWEETAQLARGSRPELLLKISKTPDVLLISTSTVSWTVDYSELAVIWPLPQLAQTVAPPESV